MTSANDRASIISTLREDLVGPTRSTDANSKQANLLPDNLQTLTDEFWNGPIFDSNGQEVIRSYPNSAQGYGIGILHAPHTNFIDDDDESNTNVVDIEDYDPSLGSAEDVSNDAVPLDYFHKLTSDEGDIDIEGCNRLKQSSMGISFAARLPEGGQVAIELPAQFHFDWQEDTEPFPTNGIYEPLYGQTLTGKKMSLWRRRNAVNPDSPAQLVCTCDELLREDGMTTIPIQLSTHCDQLKLEVQILSRKQAYLQNNERLITIVLVNNSDSTSTDLSQTLFQALLTVHFIDGAELTPFRSNNYVSDDIEERQLDLLYRNQPVWAIGHGCAATWGRCTDSPPSYLVANVLPTVELPSMSPDVQGPDGQPLSINLLPLATARGDSTWWSELELLIRSYANWIDDLETNVSQLPSIQQQPALLNLMHCKDCLERMRNGLQLLRGQGVAFEAFRLANAAMLLQQRAQKDLDQRPLVFDKDLMRARPDGQHLSPNDLSESEMSHKQWRAFQIAFLLMCIGDESGRNDVWHKCVDLIWFPTGGGKTEAYLGYAAYTMFLARMDDNQDPSGLRTDGVNVFMRYTLRMLTTQQFQRAASLICAMECIRQNICEDDFKPRHELSGSEFSLGLWIGGDGSPNVQHVNRNKIVSRDGAVTKVREWVEAPPNSYRDKNPLVLRECPWCKAQLGKADRPRNINEAIYNSGCLGGFKFAGNGASKRVDICCSDSSCPFGNRGKKLPIYVVDEDLYSQQPSFIIATVDKFAMLPYEPRARCLFGFSDTSGSRRTKQPPRLIIQDELHLISGPLGSYFGLYESLIEELCRCPDKDTLPKIVCSTATIRGANKQVQTLFARDTCRLFPAPGIDIGDSFFGSWARNTSGDSKGQLQRGRLYLGINGLSYPSALTVQVRTFSAALQSVNLLPPDQRDPWWTLLIFYNSFRDLGGSRTLFQSDIRTRLRRLWSDLNLTKEERRYTPSPLELSGRLSQEEIIEAMERLDRPYSESHNNSIGACLSSSIIEVGVDVARLSLIAIAGQPITTARYIQVTGRIGRKWKDRPGLVLMLYNATRPRDRSHFEQFQGYHERLYSQVEPTSATPFASPCLERAMHAVLVGYIRIFGGHTDYEWPRSRQDDEWDLWNNGIRLLRNRMRNVVTDATEREEAERDLNALERKRARFWAGGDFDTWNEWVRIDEKKPLLHQPGAYFGNKAGLQTPTSMRNVDAQGQLEIIDHYTRELQEGNE